MELKFTPEALEDRRWWSQHGTASAKRKIQQLLIELAEHPRTGTGKPELLSGDMKGVWSRRINQHDRILYEIHDDIILVLVLSMRGHYDDK